jgi:uncharacterized membrane protein YkvA (DUF1232 family)
MAGQTFKVTFSLDEEDTNYFRKVFKQARKDAAKQDAEEILRPAKELVEKVRGNRKTPRFVLEAMVTLEDLTQLVEDQDYGLPKRVESKVLGALAYFSNPGDLIPDEIPVFGFLDDALMIKLVEQEFTHELAGYRKFRRFRDGAEQRPWTSAAGARLPKRLAEKRKKIRDDIDRKNARDSDKRGLI